MEERYSCIRAWNIPLEELKNCEMQDYFGFAGAELKFEQGIFALSYFQPGQGDASLRVEPPYGFSRPFSRSEVTREQLEVMTRFGQIAKSFKQNKGEWIWESDERVLYPRRKIGMDNLVAALELLAKSCQIQTLNAMFVDVPKEVYTSADFKLAEIEIDDLEIRLD